MSEEDTDPNTPPAATHCHTLCLGKRRTAPAEGAMDNHETALSIAKGKGVRQPVARDQHDRLSDLPRPANAPAWAYS